MPDPEETEWEALAAIVSDTLDEGFGSGKVADQILAAGFRRLSESEKPDPREVAHIECDCVPDLGPSHCHLCSTRAGREVPWAEAHPVLSESEIRRDQAEKTMSEFEGYVTNMAETPDIRDHAYQMISGYSAEQGLFATPSPETEQETE